MHRSFETFGVPGRVAGGTSVDMLLDGFSATAEPAEAIRTRCTAAESLDTTDCLVGSTATVELLQQRPRSNGHTQLINKRIYQQRWRGLRQCAIACQPAGWNVVPEIVDDLGQYSQIPEIEMHLEQLGTWQKAMRPN